MRAFLTSLLMVLVSACSTAFEDIDSGLYAFQGRSIDDLISVIGFPDGERTVLGKRLVTWSSSQNVTTVRPVTTHSSARVDTYDSDGHGYERYSGTSTTYVPTTVNYNCTIVVEINRYKRIVGHDVEGNIGGCEQYAAALRPHFQKR